MGEILTCRALQMGQFVPGTLDEVDEKRKITGQSRDAILYSTKYFSPMFEGFFFFSFELSYIAEPSGGPSARASDISFQAS